MTTERLFAELGPPERQLALNIQLGGHITSDQQVVQVGAVITTAAEILTDERIDSTAPPAGGNDRDRLIEIDARDDHAVTSLAIAGEDQPIAPSRGRGKAQHYVTGCLWETGDAKSKLKNKYPTYHEYSFSS